MANRVARAALQVANQLHASPKVRKALIEAGIVESGLRNLNYGDRDSLGFLQQRPSSGYRRATNVRGAAADFIRRAQAVEGKYGKAGDLAQAVQRSAFPARYQQVSGQAQKIVRGSPSSGGSGGGSTTTIPGQDFSQQRKALVAQYLLGQSQGTDTQSLLDNSTNLLQTIASVRQLKDIPSRTGGGSGGGGGSSRGGTYPLGKKGKIIGTPHQGTHTLGNWQSDNANDISVPVGTPVYAARSGVISKAGPLGRSGSRFAGDRVQIDGKGDSLWYGHLSKLRVRPGQRVRRGALIGYSGSANGVAHLHFASEHGNPQRYLSR